MGETMDHDHDEISDEEIDAILAERPGLRIDAQARRIFRGFYRAAQRMMAEGCSEDEIKGLMAEAMVMARMEMGYATGSWTAVKDNGALS
jgi:hypothetical protein